MIPSNKTNQRERETNDVNFGYSLAKERVNHHKVTTGEGERYVPGVPPD